MSRPIFFTGRKAIRRKDAKIALLDLPRRSRGFDISLDLHRYRLPGDAAVIVEAYHPVYLERFPIGTVNAYAHGPHRLTELPEGDVPNFRVKIVERADGSDGKLLAAIDRISPARPEDTATNSLLGIVPKPRSEMGQELWRVHFEEGGGEEAPTPQLWVNVDAPGIYTSICAHHPSVTGLIMPEVLRQVLLRFVDIAEHWTEDDTTLGKWLRLGRRLTGERFQAFDGEDDQEEVKGNRREWVDLAVREFAERHGFLDELIQIEGSEEKDA